MAPTRHNANKTHCKRGHEFTPENTQITTQGSRQCKTCKANLERERKRRKRVESGLPVNGRIDVELRFFQKVRFDPETGCWLWTAGLNNMGYGMIGYAGKYGGNMLAHRLAYRLFVGPIPEGLDLDHLCRNTRCVNPAHLEPVTHQENIRRGFAALRPLAPCGHEYDTTDGSTRRCSICRRKQRRERYLREKAAA